MLLSISQHDPLIEIEHAYHRTLSLAYDDNDQRARLTEAGLTTRFPNKFYNAMVGGAATTTKHLWAGNTLIASIEATTTATSTIRFIHSDNLTGGNVVSDANGNVVEYTDYYPYGAPRLDTTSPTYPGEKRKFIGQEYDSGTQMSYLNARYYSGGRGQFQSEDPVHLAMGNPNRIKQLTGLDLAAYLQDPQNLNSYAYARDNPITRSDPKGLWAVKLGAEGTVPGMGLTGSAGLYIDQSGIDYYYGTGAAIGGGISANAQITTADLTHTSSVSTSVFTAGGAYVGAELSKGVTYYPSSNKLPQQYQEGGLGLATELSAGVKVEYSSPLWVWGRARTTNLSAPLSQAAGSVNYSRTSLTSSSNQGTNTSRSVSSGSSSLGQIYSSLQSVLQQLSAVLSAIKK